MKYAIIGLGAIGGTLAHYLVRTGHDVTATDADAAHVAAVRQRGLRLVAPDGTADTVHLPDVTTPGAWPAGASIAGRCVIVATKSQHVGAATRWLSGRIGADAFVLLCQNGDAFHHASKHLPADLVASALVNFAADVTEPGVITGGGAGEFAVGERDGRLSERVTEVAADFAGFGVTRASTNILGLIWGKRAIAAVLAATALADERVCVLIDRHRPVMSALAAEVLAIADAQGIEPEPVDGIDVCALAPAATEPRRRAAFDRLVGFTAGNKPRSGVFRDIAVRKRPTEAGPELEHLAALADAARLEVPAIRALARIIGELERGDRQFADANFLDMVQRAPGGARTISTGGYPDGD